MAISHRMIRIAGSIVGPDSRFPECRRTHSRTQRGARTVWVFGRFGVQQSSGAVRRLTSGLEITRNLRAVGHVAVQNSGRTPGHSPE